MQQILTTGRLLEHWHGGSMTRNSLLDDLYPALVRLAGWCERHSDDTGLLYGLGNWNWIDWTRCDLRGANLTGADLSGTDLSMADLRANLNNANLSRADLRGAFDVGPDPGPNQARIRVSEKLSISS